VQEIVARLAPRPDVATTVRRLPVRDLTTPAPTEPAPPDERRREERPSEERLSAPSASDTTLLSAALPRSSSVPRAEVAAPRGSSVPPAEFAPLSPDRYKLQLTIGGATLEKLRLAQDMLGHALPSADCAAVLDRALTALLADLAKKKFADTPTPRAEHARKPGARTPCAAVKRAVWIRDLGRCAFIGTTGHRCSERRYVEFHHVVPYVLGGEATVDGIQLRCRQHNAYEGRLYFGARRRGGGLAPEQVRMNTCL
jgi:hypothetical protein